MYESLATCPDQMLLFMHHVPYTHVLHSGKTVIQHVYDTHYEGAEMVAQFVRDWRALKGHVDDARYQAVLARLEYQRGHAVVWRDAIVQYFRKVSGVADAKGRAEGVPGRVEAEASALTGYVPVDVTPWETASKGKAVACGVAAGCSVVVRGPETAGSYDVHVLYYDERDRVSSFRLKAGEKVIAEWKADNDLPTKSPNGHSATRVTFEGVRLDAGQALTLEGVPDGDEQAVVDYVEMTKR
jgi:alpha-glucuronidase